MWTGDPVRFLAVLVVATPCPLLIAIPVAIIGSISLAATRRIVIPHPAILETIDRCRTMVLDKTGTLTFGQPTLTDRLVAPGMDDRDVLRLAACLEGYQPPVAPDVLDFQMRIAIREATDTQFVPPALRPLAAPRVRRGLRQGAVDAPKILQVI